MKTILLVDDEKSLLLSIEEGLATHVDRYAVLTAQDGREALKIMADHQVDIVVTDLKMPNMNGFELLAHLQTHYSQLPAIIMTAFNTPQIEDRFKDNAGIQLLEKPLDFDELATAIRKGLKNGYPGGTVSGMSLSNFMQLIEMEASSCLMEVHTADNIGGQIFFVNGDIHDAHFGQFAGKEAAIRLLALEDVKIKISDLPDPQIAKQIDMGLMSLLMEGARLKDETAAQEQAAAGQAADLKIASNADQAPTADTASDQEVRPAPAPTNILTTLKGDNIMQQITDCLDKFKMIEGFQAVGVFTPNGEIVAESSSNGMNLSEIGALANDILLKSQKTTEIMDIGRGQQIHVETGKAHLIARSLNEATDFSVTSPGKAHIHMVLILNRDSNLAMGKMKLESVIQEVAQHFR